ncbi:hypothetical protein, partial [Nocardia tengchongensis]|uniref:hypothetical protein n=1 Tax=Nocardia tengchongensis TaxID=2055889 RepID=UPI00368581CE
MTRNEATAGGILTVLALLVVAGWWMTPGKPGTAAGTVNPAPIPPQGDDTLAYRAVTASDNTGAVTALILGFMIGGAAMIGLFCFGPVPETRRRGGGRGAARNPYRHPRPRPGIQRRAPAGQPRPPGPRWRGQCRD